MEKQTIQFAVQSKNGVIEQVGKSIVYLEKTNYKEGQPTKWYQDKPKQKSN